MLYQVDMKLIIVIIILVKKKSFIIFYFGEYNRCHHNKFYLG